MPPARLPATIWRRFAGRIWFGTGSARNKTDEPDGRAAVQYNILKREVDTNKQLYEGLLQRLKEASVSASLKASNIRIVDVGFVVFVVLSLVLLYCVFCF